MAALVAGDPEIDSSLSRSSPDSDFKTVPLAGTVLAVRQYVATARTVWPGVSLL